MSEDETLVAVMAAIMSLITWLVALVPLAQIARPPSGTAPRRIAVAGLLVSAGVLLAVLLTLAADDVRDDARYVALYWTLGAAWVAGVMGALRLATGISLRDDVAERGNASAGWAWAGALVGMTLAFAGGNVGNGPGWWVVVACAALSTAAVFGAWVVAAHAGGVLEAILIERDPAAGLRSAFLLISLGLVAGRAVAGDWVSLEATLADFVVAAWPVLALAGLEAAIGRSAAPTVHAPARSIPMTAIIPGAGYLAIALLWLAHLGRP